MSRFQGRATGDIRNVPVLLFDHHGGLVTMELAQAVELEAKKPVLLTFQLGGPSPSWNIKCLCKLCLRIFSAKGPHIFVTEPTYWHRNIETKRKVVFPVRHVQLTR